MHTHQKKEHETPAVLKKEFLKIYEDLVSSLAKNHSRGEIKNDSMDHAEILFKHMIQAAEREIIIYTGKLNPAFYLRSDVKNAFAQFLEKPTADQVTIIHEEDINGFMSTPEFISSPFNNKKVVLIPAKGETINNGRHFIVTDQHAYREEAHSSGNNHDFCLATADFNDEKKADQLRVVADAFLVANGHLFRNDRA